MSFLLRWLFAFVLLAATYNPSQVNYIRWAMNNTDGNLPLVVLFGIVLLIGYIIYLRATLRSIGVFGMALVLGLVAAILWALVYYGLLDLSDPKLSTWIGIFALSLVLGVGLSWSIIRRKLSGQVDMDDVEE
ncbi:MULTISPECIES: DUF6524 family protein [Mameliella]|uniref:Uncharacterized protein n=1 Tax=Mameliella alba TaxID=561184 RepID=A0A0B3S247_9RHOB|nr:MULTISPECIES: DUF6524 family protein [Mameliella]MBV6638686.1 hypothetical protein [Mameliella sp.]ODM48912.1 hypothetical protein A9320_18165 [Ruegeria sp. PBVC088]KHQ54382.1 hypothetical protein OA50_00974 [Mameliella alba]MBY6118460.1 hypothetical protein [Mameliella alba]MDD9733479.1 DUF6524 family protein [Mameliella sp. AT18]